LAVPVICGNDLMQVSNFSFKPLRVVVFEPSSETKALVEKIKAESMRFKSQRTARDFRIKGIKVSRELKRNPNYRPHFINYPMTTRSIKVELDEEEYRALQSIKKRGTLGKKDGEILRSAFLSWWMRKDARGTQWY